MEKIYEIPRATAARALCAGSVLGKYTVVILIVMCTLEMKSTNLRTEAHGSGLHVELKFVCYIKNILHRESVYLMSDPDFRVTWNPGHTSYSNKSTTIDVYYVLARLGQVFRAY